MSSLFMASQRLTLYFGEALKSREKLFPQQNLRKKVRSQPRIYDHRCLDDKHFSSFSPEGLVFEKVGGGLKEEGLWLRSVNKASTYK